MPYKPTYDVSGSVGAIPAVSMWASAIGSAVVALPFMLAAIIVYPIAFVLGTVGVALCLAIVGPPIDLVLRHTLGENYGPMVPVVIAFALATILAAALGGMGYLIFVLPYAIPAVLLYHRQIELEKSLSG